MLGAEPSRAPMRTPIRDVGRETATRHGSRDGDEVTDTNTKSPKWVHEMAPYVPGKPISDLKRELGLTDIIKLASNENPLGPSPDAIQAMQDEAASMWLYPDPGSVDLREALAARLGVEPSEVLVGNGSNELISLLVATFTTPSENVVTSQYAFIAYKVVCGAAGVPIREVPSDDFRIDVEGLIAACDADTRILFVANPNNPTGTHLDAEQVAKLLRDVPAHVLLVMDEAYFEYADANVCPDAMTLRHLRENVVVMRTFSKAYGLAGCRLGYAVAPAYVAERVNRVREPFNVNRVAQAGALAALADQDHIARCAESNAEVRDALCAGLTKLGLRFWPSQTNFVLFESAIPGAVLNDKLLRAGVIVRPMRGYGLPNHLRVTVGTPSENERFLSALTTILKEEQS